MTLNEAGSEGIAPSDDSDTYTVDFVNPNHESINFNSPNDAFIAAALHVAGSVPGKALMSKNGTPSMCFWREGTEVVCEFWAEGQTEQASRPIEEILRDPTASQMRKEIPYLYSGKDISA